MGKQCFRASALEFVRLPPLLKAVEENTFSECKDLKAISLSNGLKKIEWFCFAESGLEQVTFPDGVKEIGEKAFSECK